MALLEYVIQVLSNKLIHIDNKSSSESNFVNTHHEMK